MTDREDQPKPASAASGDTASAAKRALELKRAAKADNPAVTAGRQEGERAAAARSASKSKPWMRRH
jgi:hypothetical protein